MAVLFLGPECPRLIEFLEVKGETVYTSSERIRIEEVHDFEFLVSYGYRYLIPASILELFPSKAINLHISYLPWNRGADPNFWSFFENTPKGVTLHYLDSTLDTGDILAQSEVLMSEDETLASSYAKLKTAIEDLFEQTWDVFREGRAPRIPQTGPGTSHRAGDKQPYLALLEKGWDTPAAWVAEQGARARQPRS